MTPDRIPHWPLALGPRRALRAALVIVAALLVNFLPQVRAEQESPYRIDEFAVRVAPGSQSWPALSGKWLLWRDNPNDTQRIAVRNLETGLDSTVVAADSLGWPVDIGGDFVVTVEMDFDQTARLPRYGIFGYRLPEGQRFAIAPFRGGTSDGAPFYRSAPKTDGKTVVWAEGTADNFAVAGYDLAARRPISITGHLGTKESPAVSASLVVWRDRRHVSSTAVEADIYGYDLSSRREFRITVVSEVVGLPAVSGSTAFWIVRRGDATLVVGYDVATRQTLSLAALPSDPLAFGLDADGDFVVWSTRGDLDEDVFAHDLKQDKRFVVTRAIGPQSSPRVSGRTIAWLDGRRSGIGKYEDDGDLYAARLENGPAPLPPATGVPTAADAKVEIVWPHGGAPVTVADKANVGAWLFLPDSLSLAPCQWNPTVRLWRALDNEPARQVATGRKVARYDGTGRAAVPVWEFNDVDVSPARDPVRKLYFFVTADGIPGRSNVWAHGADARTYSPRQDVPGGVIALGSAVEAKIEIVWPHGDAPVDQARLVNLSAMLFAPGTLLSAPPDWNPTVRLFRALNDEVGYQVAIGEKRLVASPAGSYPVWDFNDVDVSAASDPANKYYFTLAVDGVTTHSNVWAHGADARTYFPEMDVPTQDCRGS